MIYRPQQPWLMWDSWLFEWQGTFHLYHMEKHGDRWDHVGHAVSQDLVHWQARPSILTIGKAGEWNEERTLTGMVVRHQGRFYMFAGSRHHSVELVGVYVSDDLDNWEPYPGNPVMRPAGPHYLTVPAPPRRWNVDWRDPCITYRKETGCYHAVLCARLPTWSHKHTGAALAHIRSRDLLRWEHLPPIDAPVGRFYDTEVPDIFELAGRTYLLFSTNTRSGIRLNTPSRDDAVGTFYLVGESFKGPFVLPDDYLLIGVGHGKMASYVGRTIPYQGGRLLYHHISASRATWGSPKMVGVEDDGSLYLQYLPLLAKLETGVLCRSPEEAPCFEVQDLGEWQRGEGVIEGQAAVVGSACKIARDVADLHLTCQISASRGARAGVVLRSAEGDGVLIALNFERKRLEIGYTRYTRDGPFAGWGIDPYGPFVSRGIDLYRDVCRCDLQYGRDYHLRCFARDEHFEVYLDGRWVFTSVFPDAAQAGDVELVVERGAARFSELRLVTIEPLD